MSNRDGKYKPGPWSDEPDHVEFRSGGLACLLHRSSLGAWCGYVGVPPGHPWHGAHYDDVPADVHGGLTYAEKCQGEICHVPEPGESDDVWWLGFDCAHAGDMTPTSQSYFDATGFGRVGGDGGTYRDLAYVRAETERLAAQAAEAATKEAASP